MVALRLTAEEVATLFAYMDIATAAMYALQTGEWKPKASDENLLKTYMTAAGAASLEQPMKELRVWVRGRERRRDALPD